jgi:hypothetical protein
MPTAPTTSNTGATGTPSGGGVRQNQIAISGNIVSIYFGGVLVGYLDEFSSQEDFGLQPLVGIGDGRPQEWVPGMYNATLTATRGVIMGPSLFTLLNGGAQNGGGGDGGPAFGNMAAALKGYVFDVTEQQKGQSGQTLKVFRNCSFSSVSCSVRANAILMMNITMRCLDATAGGDGDFSGTGAQYASGNMDNASGT